MIVSFLLFIFLSLSAAPSFAVASQPGLTSKRQRRERRSADGGEKKGKETSGGRGQKKQRETTCAEKGEAVGVRSNFSTLTSATASRPDPASFRSGTMPDAATPPRRVTRAATGSRWRLAWQHYLDAGDGAGMSEAGRSWREGCRADRSRRPQAGKSLAPLLSMWRPFPGTTLTPPQAEQGEYVRSPPADSEP
jgi:hypothetical protein